MSKGLTNALENAIKKIIEEELDAMLSTRGIEVVSKPQKPDKRLQKVRVLKDLEKRGYLLENDVYRIIQTHEDWYTQPQRTFWDLKSADMPSWKELQKDVELQLNRGFLQKKIRTIDFQTEKTVSLSSKIYHSSTIELIIECKHRSKENWVFFFEDEDDPEFRKNLISRGGGHGVRGDISLFTTLSRQRFGGTIEEDFIDQLMGNDYKSISRASHHSIMNLPEYATVGYTIFSDTDSLNDSCIQVLDAAIFREASRESNFFENPKDSKRYPHWHIYPVIIIDNPIWVLSYSKRGKPQLKEASWIPFLANRNDYEYMIDIVTFDGFRKYLELIETELNELSQLGEE